MYESAGRLWWEGITGPSRMIREIVTGLQKAKSLLLCLPDDLPWREQMRSTAENLLKENDSELLITYIDGQTDIEDVNDAAEYLLNRFADLDMRSGYRSSFGLTVCDYIAKERVLKDRILWIRGLGRRQFDGWYSFCKEYKATDRYGGLFVIETDDSIVLAGKPKQIEYVQYCNFTSLYDTLLFNSMVASSLPRSNEWKQYLSTLSSMLCGNDAELSDRFLRHTDFSQSEPLDALQNCLNTPHFEKRRESKHLDQHHPLSLLRNGNISELQVRLWKAQLQTLFPLIELERISFITAYRREVEEALSIPYWDAHEQRACRLMQTGEYITNANDAEIGTLYRMIHLRRAEDIALYLLFLPSDAEREYLSLLRDMRNTLAHIGFCPFGQVNQLLSRHPYAWKTESDDGFAHSHLKPTEFA